MRLAVVFQCLHGSQGREHGVAVVRPPTAIEPAIGIEVRRPRTQAVTPAHHRRLLVQMTVEQDRIAARCAIHFEQQQWCAIRRRKNLELAFLDALLLHPLLHQCNGPLHVAVLAPFGIELRRLVGNLDVARDRGYDLVVPEAIDVVLCLLLVHI